MPIMSLKSNFLLSMLLRTLAMIGLVILCVPWSPWMPNAGLDASWVFVLHHAFAEAWQWGKDIIFTFGPLGFTYAGMFHPETYSIMLLGQLFLIVSIGYAIFSHAKDIPSTMLLFILPGLWISMVFSYDLVLLAVPFMLVFFAAGKSCQDRVLGVILSVLCAYVSLVKFTAFMLVVPLVIISDICLYKKIMKVHITP